MLEIFRECLQDLPFDGEVYLVAGVRGAAAYRQLGLEEHQHTDELLCRVEVRKTPRLNVLVNAPPTAVVQAVRESEAGVRVEYVEYSGKPCSFLRGLEARHLLGVARVVWMVSERFEIHPKSYG